MRSTEIENFNNEISHCANEWDDMATTGIIRLKNVKDGISSVDGAILNMKRRLEFRQSMMGKPSSKKVS